MSFSANPYRWFTFFSTSDGKHIVLECQGCGHESVPFDIDMSVSALMDEQREHLMEAHGKWPGDFSSWSQPNHRDQDVPAEYDMTRLTAAERHAGFVAAAADTANRIPPYTEPTELVPNERRRLADYLSQYAHGVVEEWMRIVEIDEDIIQPGSSAIEARMTWMGDSTFALGSHPYKSDLGNYRLTVKMEALADPPPMGPENDPALVHEIEPVEPAPEWVPAEWRYVLSRDHVRLGGQEADVTTSSVTQWHADNTDSYHPKPWEHTEVRVRLAHLGDAMLDFPPAAPVEILMGRERQAVYMLQKA